MIDLSTCDMHLVNSHADDLIRLNAKSRDRDEEVFSTVGRRDSYKRKAAQYH
jgi:hypothetical protein